MQHWILLHHHRHGVSTVVIKHDGMPIWEPIEEYARMSLDYDKDRDDEYLECHAVGVLTLAEIQAEIAK